MKRKAGKVVRVAVGQHLLSDCERALETLEGDDAAKAFEEAVVAWLWLGNTLEVCVDYPREKAERIGATIHPEDNAILCQAESKAFEMHRRSVDVLMREAERCGVDSTLLEVSGRYCRELLKERHDGEVFHSSENSVWPDFLGTKLFSLPADIRSAIVMGNAAVHRVLAIMNVKDPSISKRVALKKWDHQPDGLNPPNRLKRGQKQVELEPLPFKVLHHMWEAERPVSESALIDAVWGQINEATKAHLKSPINKANQALLECGFEWQIRRKNGYVTRGE